MGLSIKGSFLVSSILTVGLFSAMQLFSATLASSKIYTFVGGLLGSVLFVFMLTAVGNLETIVMGKIYQTGLFEVLLCLFVAVMNTGYIHGVSGTSCFLFSLIGLYYVNKASQRVHSAALVTEAPHGKRRKNK